MSGMTLRVLVADDDEVVRFMSRRCLAGSRPGGARVVIVEAVDGDVALARLRDVRVDGVLSDHRMPGATGFDVLAYARAHQPSAFRALMSGFLDPAVAARTQEDGLAHHAFEKPLSSHAFEAALVDVLHRLERHLRDAPGDAGPTLGGIDAHDNPTRGDESPSSPGSRAQEKRRLADSNH